MATEMITLKLESAFLKEIDELATARYQNRTELIKEALRDKMHKISTEKALLRAMQDPQFKAFRRVIISEGKISKLSLKERKELGKNLKGSDIFRKFGLD